MEYRNLGNTSTKVSAICLGTMTWGQQNSEAEAFEQIEYSLDQGVNFFDTAEMYPVPPKENTCSKTEIILGNWFSKSKKRENVILATKITGPSQFLHWIRGGITTFTKKNLKSALEGSLNRLKTDYIDLYQIHWPNRNTNYFGKMNYVPKDESQSENFHETIETLNEFIKQGLIRHYGLSNESPWGIMNYLSVCSNLELIPPVSVQNPYSLLNRLFEIGNAEVSHRENISLLPYSPLGFGVLSGKYLAGKKPKNSRLDLFGNQMNRYSSNESMSATSLYNRLAIKNNISLTNLSLAFTLTRPYVASTIIGATTMAQLKENINSCDVKLSQDILQAIDIIHKKQPNPAP